MGLLDPIKTLASSLSSLALVGALFKPIPSIITDVQDAVNGLGLLPAGLELNAVPQMVNNAACTVNYTMSAPSNITFEYFNRSAANVYRFRQQYAVNLGGWFVHEDWMTPTLFACAAGNRSSELDLASGFASINDARQALEQHWDTFIDLENDFAYLAGLGINTLRLPVGYWSLGPEFTVGTAFEPVGGVYNNSWPRVMNAISAAERHGLGVIVDLHGAPGSQNGLATSGISDGVQGLFGNATNIAATQSVLAFMTQQLAAINNVVGIELLNEPSDVPELENFYNATIAIMRNQTDEAAHLPLYIHDAYNLTRFASFAANRTDMVIVDHHAYYVSGVDEALTASNTTTASLAARDVPASALASTASAAGEEQGLNSTTTELVEAANITHRNLIIGEWSCALSNASLAGQTDPLGAREKFCSAQQAMYANVTSGWAFWSYTLEQCSDSWCFRSAIGSDLPNTFSAFTVPDSSNVMADAAVMQKIAALAQKSDGQILNTNIKVIDTSSLRPSLGISSASGSSTWSAVPSSGSATSSVAGSSAASSTLSPSLSSVSTYAMPSSIMMVECGPAPTSMASVSSSMASLESASSAMPVSVSASQVVLLASSMSSVASSGSATPVSASSISSDDSDNESATATTVGFAAWFSDYIETASMFTPSAMSTGQPVMSTATAVFTAQSASDSEEPMPTPAPGDAFYARRPESANAHEKRWRSGRLSDGLYRPRIHPRDFLARRTDYTAQEQTIIRAYGDGFATAKAFAQQNGSRLAFVHQMIHDNVVELLQTPDLSDGMQEVYADWFRAGLEEAEAQIQQVLSSSSTSAQRVRFGRR